MTIRIFSDQEEDLDLLCNSLNAEAGKYCESNPCVSEYLLRAQAAINKLCEMIKDKE
jgi:hypothetical protein